MKENWFCTFWSYNVFNVSNFYFVSGQSEFTASSPVLTTVLTRVDSTTIQCYFCSFILKSWQLHLQENHRKNFFLTVATCQHFQAFVAKLVSCFLVRAELQGLCTSGASKTSCLGIHCFPVPKVFSTLLINQFETVQCNKEGFWG